MNQAAKNQSIALTLAAGLLLPGGAAPGALPAQAGKPPQPPYSWRGIDGSGVFPAGDLVTTFWDVSKGESLNEEERKSLPDVVKEGTSRNVVWRTLLPFWGHNAPVVMGDKVFLLTEEGWKDEAPQLVCLSAIDGKILWKRPADHLDAWPEDRRKEAKKLRALDQRRWREHMTWWHKLYIDPKTGEPADPGKERWDRLLREARAAGWAFPPHGKVHFTQNYKLWRGRYGRWAGGSSGAPLDESLLNVWRRCHGERIYWRPGWTSEGPFFGNTMGSVVGDGKAIYAVTALGGAAAYDPDGNRLWVTDLGVAPVKPAGPCDDGLVGLQIASPVLAAGRLVYFHRDVPMMYGLDCATGKILWKTRPVMNADAGRQGRHTARGFAGHMAPGGTPVVMRIRAGEAKETIVVSGHGMVVRVRDGKYLGQVRMSSARDPAVETYDSTYHSWTARGDVLYSSIYRNVHFATRLAIENDALVQERLWRSESRGDWRNSNLVLLGDRLFAGRIRLPGRKRVEFGALDVATGRMVESVGKAVSSKNPMGFAVTPDTLIAKAGLPKKGAWGKVEVLNRQYFETVSMPDAAKRLGFGYLASPITEQIR